MPRTYEPINTTTLTSTSQSVTFSSIPGIYTDLVLVYDGTATEYNALGLQFNNDTGSNYSNTFMTGDGTTAASSRGSNQTQAFVSISDSGKNSSIIHIMNYSNSTTNKTAIGRGGSVGQVSIARVSMWRNTSAITTIKVIFSGTNFNTSSTFSLYGIRSA